MVHSFKIDDCRIAADVNSGAVHVVEEIVFDILRLIDKNRKKNALTALLTLLAANTPNRIYMKHITK